MSTNSSDDVIEEIGRYKLVARIHKGVARGVLWRDGQRLVDVTAASGGEAHDNLHKAFYELLIEKAREQGDNVPEDAQVAQALLAIWAQLTDGQIAMLRAHYHAPKRQMTTTQLALAAKYKGYSAANLWYGRVGWLLFGELPRPLPFHTKDGKPVYTSAIAQAPKDFVAIDENWIWEMRPEVARGLELAKLVN